jgi:hypothetical protein
MRADFEEEDMDCGAASRCDGLMTVKAGTRR